jgi:hypothetical protein
MVLRQNESLLKLHQRGGPREHCRYPGQSETRPDNINDRTGNAQDTHTLESDNVCDKTSLPS